jgi:predicted GNAT family N-acyltransferase
MSAKADLSRPEYVLVRLTSAHKVRKFRCGIESLDVFLRSHALKNQELGLATTNVICTESTNVVGYYTLSYGELAVRNLPDAERKRLSNHPVPVVRIGRLAVDLNHRKFGLGGVLLVSAIRHAVIASVELGAFAIEVDALSEEVVSFYEHFGFRALTDDPKHLYLPMQAARGV